MEWEGYHHPKHQRVRDVIPRKNWRQTKQLGVHKPQNAGIGSETIRWVNRGLFLDQLSQQSAVSSSRHREHEPQNLSPLGWGFTTTPQPKWAAIWIRVSVWVCGAERGGEQFHDIRTEGEEGDKDKKEGEEQGDGRGGRGVPFRRPSLEQAPSNLSSSGCRRPAPTFPQGACHPAQPLTSLTWGLLTAPSTTTEETASGGHAEWSSPLLVCLEQKPGLTRHEWSLESQRL